MKQFSVIDKKTGRLTTIWFKYGNREFKSVREITERFKDIDENDTKQMKLDELKAMVRAWTKEKSLTTAYDICEFLANNLDLEESRPVIVNGVEYDSYADYLKSREEEE